MLVTSLPREFDQLLGDALAKHSYIIGREIIRDGSIKEHLPLRGELLTTLPQDYGYRHPTEGVNSYGYITISNPAST